MSSSAIAMSSNLIIEEQLSQLSVKSGSREVVDSKDAVLDENVLAGRYALLVLRNGLTV